MCIWSRFFSDVPRCVKSIECINAMLRGCPRHCLPFVAALASLTAAAPLCAQDETIQRNRAESRPPRTSATANEVLLRGPVHEAFAQPVAIERAASLALDVKPPAPPAEYPSAVRPARADSVWLPGYWAWERADERYVWIPGIWRIAPPGMRWSPGYWSDADGRATWIAGFWYPRDRVQLRYLPEPPDEAGDDDRGVAPASDFFYVPGYWVFSAGKYVWKSGHWSPAHSGWVWMPTRAESTPSGSLLLPGYWDYSLPKRGVLFAPLALGGDDGEDDVAQDKRPPAVVTPRVAIDPRRLSEYLFIDPASKHYCFGDYFAAVGDGLRAVPAPKADVVPWYDFAGGSDPLFVYDQSTRRHLQPDWQAALRGRYAQRRRQAELRPPTVWTDGRTAVASGDEADGNAADAVSSPGVTLMALARDRTIPLKLTTVTGEELARAARQAEYYKLLANQRKKFESDAGGPPEGDKTRALVVMPPPDPAPPAEPASRPTSGTTGGYVPGVKGREVPGLSGRTLPGMAGRSVPGVDTTAPGVVGPGVSPGADTRGELRRRRPPAGRAPSPPQ